MPKNQNNRTKENYTFSEQDTVNLKLRNNEIIKILYKNGYILFDALREILHLMR